MDPVVMSMVAAGLTLAAGALAVQYRGKYAAALASMGDAAQFLGAVSDVITEMQKALADEKVTPDEVRAIAAKLEKFQPLMAEIQKILTK